ncbi:acyltransferase [Marinobacter sp. M1N3S26]|uniref:acyltransferase n=1 Tax=Marinobacter sp. M1N3S26 TaxID=3382299 RepID=UPI00387A89A4
MTTRQVIKRTIKMVFLILAAPLYLLFLGLAAITQEDSTFQGFSQALSLIPSKIGTYLRAAFYRLACPDTSDDISVGFLTLLSHRDTTIKRGVYIGPQCNIGKCTIGENTLVGSGVHILSGSRQHAFDDIDRPIQEQGGHFEKIHIGDDCWLGNGAVVLAPIGNQAIVAAGTVVSKPVREGEVVAGNPARLIRNRLETASATEPTSDPVEAR